MSVYDDIRAEEARQEAKGRDAAHDDARDIGQWFECLLTVVERNGYRGRTARETFVKVGCVAVKAIKAIDRKNGNTTTNDTAAPVTEDELADVERLDAQATHGPGVADGGDVNSTANEWTTDEFAVVMGGTDNDAAFIARARTLLPRLAASYRRAEQIITRIDGERALMSADLDTLRTAIERVTGRTGTAEQLASDLAATVEALAKKIADHDEQDRLVSRDHQRLEDRVVQAEADRDRARAVTAQAEALMQDRERLTQRVRDLETRLAGYESEF